jgi:hypothetical protein
LDVRLEPDTPLKSIRLSGALVTRTFVRRQPR